MSSGLFITKKRFRSRQKCPQKFEVRPRRGAILQKWNLFQEKSHFFCVKKTFTFRIPALQYHFPLSVQAVNRPYFAGKLYLCMDAALKLLNLFSLIISSLSRIHKKLPHSLISDTSVPRYSCCPRLVLGFFQEG